MTKGIGGKLNVFGEAGKGTFKAAVNSAVHGAAASAITQGIGVATGLQSKFSFAGVAAAGVAAGVGEALGSGLGELNGNGLSAGNIASHIAVGAARSIASAATRSAIEGSSFSRALAAGLPDVIGQVVGQAIGGAVDGGGRDEPQEIAERVKVSTDPTVRQPEISSSPIVDRNETTGTVAEIVVLGERDRLDVSLASLGIGGSGLSIFADWVRDNFVHQDTHRTQRVQINSLKDAEGFLASSARAIEIDGIKENGFDILFNLTKIRNSFIAQSAGGAIDDLIPGEMLDIFRDKLGDAVGPDTFGGDVSAFAAYVEVLANYGPGDPTSDWTNLGEYLGDRIIDPIAARAVFNTYQNYLDRDAAQVYRETGNIQPLQERAIKRYIREFNLGYEEALELQDSGALAQRYGRMAENFRLGFQTDLFARGAITRWFDVLGIDPSSDPNIRINQRTYKSREDVWKDATYRIPDLQVGDVTIEGTLWKKNLDTPQIADVVDWSDPRRVVIVNPYDHNGGQVRRFRPR